MATTIKHYRSGTATNTPSVGNLEYGVLALNYNDGKIFYKNSSDAVAEFTSGSASLTNTTDTNGWLQFASATTYTSGALLKIKNNTNTVFKVNFDGSLGLESVSSKGSAVTGKFVFDGTDIYIGV